MGKLAAEAAPTSSTGSRVRIFRRHPRGGGTGAQRAERPQAARRASEASHPVVPAAADGESSRLKPLLQDQGLAASVAPAWRPRWLPGRLLVPGVLLVQLHRDRKSVVSGQSVSVRLEHGGRRNIK